MNSNGHQALDTLSPFDDPDLAQDMRALDLDTLRQEAIRQGIDISQPKVQQAIAARRAKARDLAIASAPNQPSKYFYKLRNGITFVGNALLLILMLLLSYALLPVSILGLAYAEVQRVSLGVALFDAPRANLMAIVAVSSYLILLVVQASANRTNPDQARPVFSFRLLLSDLAYLFGIARKWTPKNRSKQQLLGIAISRLGWLIIVLGTAGSLKDELSGSRGSWYQAIEDIMLHSDLLTFLALVGGVSLTAGLLAALHFSTELAYGQWQKLIPESGADFLGESVNYSDAADLAEWQFLMSILEKAKK